jgi:hypothetical protein
VIVHNSETSKSTKPSREVINRPSAPQQPHEHTEAPILIPTKRIKEEDQLIARNVEGEDLSNRLFLRLGAKGKSFRTVSFRYTIFQDCYLRDCIFDSCDFTGCRFVGTNMPGSSFLGCVFDYASFEQTTIASEILRSGCPATENLIAKFARSLRLNFQQLGDSASANRAIGLELKATKTYLHKAWHSSESYYRRKYMGAKRLQMFLRWLWFGAGDFAWGHGESVAKLARAVLIVLVVMVPLDIHWDKSQSFLLVASYGHAIAQSFQLFLDADSPSFFPKSYLAIIAVLRLIAGGLLVSIIVKRTSRR